MLELFCSTRQQVCITRPTSRLFQLSVAAIALMGSNFVLACPAPAIGLPGQDVQLSVEHDGITRGYTLHIPASYDCSSPTPLLIGVHGYGGTGLGFENETARIFDRLEESGYIGLFPDGVESSPGSGVTAFNDLGSRNDDSPEGSTCLHHVQNYPAFENCGPDEPDRACTWGTSCADDVGYLQSLINLAKSELNIDEDRVFLMGFSQGAQTVATLACLLEDEIAAVVPVHGLAARGWSCGPQSKVSLLQVWGIRDNWVPLDGTASADGLLYESEDQAARVWAMAQGCSSEPTPFPTSADGVKRWSCYTHADCATEATIVSCGWHGGHQWPRTRRLGEFGLDVIWDFLEQQ